MPISEQSLFQNPQKSPWNFERCHSKMESLMMQRLDADPTVFKWMKRHGVTIPWIDSQKHQRRYVPDFFVEFTDGRKAVLEVKDPSRMDSPDVLRKRKAAEIWCKQRHMGYVMYTF